MKRKLENMGKKKNILLIQKEIFIIRIDNKQIIEKKMAI